MTTTWEDDIIFPSQLEALLVTALIVLTRRFEPFQKVKIEYFYKSIETKDEYETFFYNFDFEHSGFCIQFDYNLGKSLLKQDSKVYPEISKFDLDSVGEFFAKKVLNNIYAILNEAISKNCKNPDDLNLSIPVLTNSSKNPSVKNQFVVNPQKMCCLLSVLCNLQNGNSGLINILISKDFLQSEIIQKYIFCQLSNSHYSLSFSLICFIKKSCLACSAFNLKI